MTPLIEPFSYFYLNDIRLASSRSLPQAYTSGFQTATVLFSIFMNKIFRMEQGPIFFPKTKT